MKRPSPCLLGFVLATAVALPIQGMMNWTRNEGLWQTELEIWVERTVLRVGDFLGLVEYGPPGSFWAATVTDFLLALPAIFAAIFVYHLFVGPGYRDGQSRCRKCGQVFRKLAKPLCPACGEPV